MYRYLYPWHQVPKLPIRVWLQLPQQRDYSKMKNIWLNASILLFIFSALDVLFQLDVKTISRKFCETRCKLMYLNLHNFSLQFRCGQQLRPDNRRTMNYL